MNKIAVAMQKSTPRAERPAVARSNDRRGPAGLMQQVLPEELFVGMLCLERKKAERSQKKLLLVLLDATDALHSLRHREVRGRLVRAVDAVRRETDIAGWCQQDGILGTIFTEMGNVDEASVLTVANKVRETLDAELSPEDLKRVHMSVHVFGSDGQNPDLPPNTGFYPDLLDRKDSKRIPLLVKRFMMRASSAAESTSRGSRNGWCQVHGFNFGKQQPPYQITGIRRRCERRASIRCPKR